MLARVLSAAVDGIEAFPVEVEVNSGWGDMVVVILSSILRFRDQAGLSGNQHDGAHEPVQESIQRPNRP
jgi:hypothetical protein